MKLRKKDKPESHAVPIPSEMLANWAPRCPVCHETIHEQATVERFGEPRDWQFWGYPGSRWRRCEGETGGKRFVHFRVDVNGRLYGRLAWIRPAEDKAMQEALL